MLHVGLDLSRSRVDVRVVDATGRQLLRTTACPDREGLRRLAAKVSMPGEEVHAAIESMTGARFVRDVLQDAGWEVLVADAAKVKGVAPLACKTDKIDAGVLAELSRRDLVPAIWLPPDTVREQRELARFRLHLVKHRSMLKQRIHSSLMTCGYQSTAADQFGVTGRQQLERLELAPAWSDTVRASLLLIDYLDVQIDDFDRQLRQWGAQDPAVRRLMSCPGIGWVLGTTLAAEIGDIHRFPTAKKFVGYSGLCPRVYQSGDLDRRGPLAKNGPAVLRWALIEAATHACNHPAYKTRYQRTRTRLGRQRGPRVARVEVARDLAKAIWYVLTKDTDFAPAGAASDLAA